MTPLDRDETIDEAARMAEAQLDAVLRAASAALELPRESRFAAMLGGLSDQALDIALAGAQKTLDLDTDVEPEFGGVAVYLLLAAWRLLYPERCDPRLPMPLAEFVGACAPLEASLRLEKARRRGAVVFIAPDPFTAGEREPD